jgi:hypothetical protein
VKVYTATIKFDDDKDELVGIFVSEDNAWAALNLHRKIMYTDKNNVVHSYLRGDGVDVTEWELE